MSTPDIRLVRIDNRLIHGQVATAWTQFAKVNLLLVSNDEVSTDQMRQSLMNMAAPNGTQTRYFSIEKTINIIHKASESQHIGLIVENPIDVLRLVEGGVPITRVNVGNMHQADGKKELTKTVYASPEEIDAFKKLLEKGIYLEYRQVPSNKEVDMSTISDLK